MVTKQALHVSVKAITSSHPWLLALVSQVSLVVIAFIIQLLGKHIILLSPWNWIVLGMIILGTSTLGMWFARANWVRWAGSAPFAVTIILIVAVMSAFGTFIVQDPSKMDMLARFGLRTMFANPPFATAILLMLCNLSVTTGRRLALPRPGQIGFLLNHVGLILVILGMFAGTAQFKRVTLRLHEGEMVSQGIDAQGKAFDLGGNVTLNAFDIEKYPPKLVAAEFAGQGNSEKLVTDQDWVSENHDFTAFGTKIHILAYYPMAMPDVKDGWKPVDDRHSLPAVFIRLTLPDGRSREDWVVAGVDSLGIPPTTVAIDDTHVVGLLEPEAKAFRSHLAIKKPEKDPADYVLEVNRPVRVGSWQLYQNSYELKMSGRTSIIEAIRDPALPVVYCGLIAMLIGAFVALWGSNGRRKDFDLGIEQAKKGNK